MECIVNLFADDTSVQQKIIDITSFDAVNIGIFCVCLDLENNAFKTEYMIITRRRNRLNHPDLYLNGDVISEVDQHTHLHVTISN